MGCAGRGCLAPWGIKSWKLSELIDLVGQRIDDGAQLDLRHPGVGAYIFDFRDRGAIPRLAAIRRRGCLRRSGCRRLRHAVLRFLQDFGVLLPRRVDQIMGVLLGIADMLVGDDLGPAEQVHGFGAHIHRDAVLVPLHLGPQRLDFRFGRSQLVRRCGQKLIYGWRVIAAVPGDGKNGVPDQVRCEATTRFLVANGSGY